MKCSIWRAQVPPFSDEQALELDYLLAHFAGLSRTAVRIHDPELTPVVQAQLEAAIQRRQHGEPLAYILGQRGFYGLDLEVNPATLIPRPETELLVDWGLAQMHAHATVADLGTGSGAIALALAKHRPEAQILACDLSLAALATAARNAQRLGIENIGFAQMNWGQGLAPKAFDFIFSNPPYIAPDDAHLAALTFEPRQALVAAEDGFADLFFLLTTAQSALKTGGWLALEHGATQGETLRRAAAKLPQWRNIATHRDYGQRERITVMQCSL